MGWMGRRRYYGPMQPLDDTSKFFGWCALIICTPVLFIMMLPFFPFYLVYKLMR